MKRYLYSLFFLLVLCICLGNSGYAQQSVLDPNDPIVNYNSENPPSIPTQAGIMVKWVRTPRVGWNTSPYKAYYYSTGYHIGIPFRLQFPESYGTDPNKKYPMLIFFHGGGEISKLGYYDNELQLVNCGHKIMEEVLNGSFDGFVLFPQATNTRWGSFFNDVVGIINYMIDNNHLDKSRITVSGLSSGGRAVWSFIENYPRLAAGATPISAARPWDAKQSVVDSIQSIPIWLSQGALDRSLSKEETQTLVDYFRNNRVDIRYTLYPNKGHGVWNAHYEEPDAFSWMVQVNKTNPNLFSGTTTYCIGSTIRDTLALTAGFEAYQWSKNGVVIPGATSNTLIVTDTGTYAARYKSKGEWTYWSPSPVKITYKQYTLTPPIQVSGMASDVLPAPDGSTAVTLALPPGFESYEWRNASGQVLGTDSLYTATSSGDYVATVTEINGCPAKPSDTFHVAADSGPNPPDPASGLNGFAVSQTEIHLNWSNNLHPINNETSFEVYRAKKSGGAYTLVGKIPSDTLQFIDEGLVPNTNYFYIVRAVNETAAAPVSTEVEISTLVDAQAPEAPDHLILIGATSRTVSLQWNTARDNIAVRNYGIYINGVRSYLTTDTSFTVRNLIQGQTYVFTVKAFDPTGNISSPSNQVVATTVYPGLKYRYYTYTGEWNSLHDLNMLTPIDSGTLTNISLAPKTRNDKYAFSYQGYIEIPQAGTYTFYTKSNDGSILYINDGQVVNNDGKHGIRERSGQYTFNRAGLYPFRVDYFQATGNAYLTVSWKKTTGQTFGKSTIPDSVFVNGLDTDGEVPEIPTNVTAQAVSFDSVIVNWQDKSTSETGFEVYRSIQSAGSYQIIYTAKNDSVAYVDTTVSPATTYFYRVKAINQYGTSVFDSQSTQNSATTPELPSVPAAPANLDATPVSMDRINLSWNPATGNITRFEIYRSDGDNTDFRKLTTLSADYHTYADSGLYSNSQYFYKLKATNAGGTSEFSNEVSTTTFNTLPQLSARATYYAHYDSTIKIKIYAADKDNEALTFTAGNLPVFGSFTDNGDRTGIFIFSPSESQQGTYSNIKLWVVDEHGGKDSATFSLKVSDVAIPNIQQIPPIQAATFTFVKDTIRLTKPDTAGTVSWQITNLPSFVDTVTTQDGYLVLQIGAEAKDTGNYNFQVKVSNVYGEDDKTVSLNIIANPLQKWYLNFASDYSWLSFPGSPWNNIHGIVTTQLEDNQGHNTDVGLTLQTSLWQTTAHGAQTGNNSGIYPDNVMRDNYYLRGQGNRSVTGQITGLNPEKSYILTFFSSSVWGFTNDNGHTVFQAGSQKDSIDVQGNTDGTLSFTNLTPSPSGTLTFTMSRGTDAEAAYLNALVISTQASIPPSTPVNVQLSNKIINGANAVQLNWQLGSNNASTIKVFRSESRTGTYNLLNNEVPNGSATQYIDTTVAPNTSVTYYYYLVASNAFGNSVSTDTLSITTNQYVDNRKWYINIASDYSWMPLPDSPWNNIHGTVTQHLKDNEGHSSNVGLTFQTSNWQTSAHGAQTGNNSGIYPDNVLRDNYYIRGGGNNSVTVQITGLDPEKSYVITVLASSVWGFTNDNGHTVFQAGSQKDSIDVQGNTDGTLSLTNLTPSPSGTITFTMSRAADAEAAYLNALVVSTQASTPPVVPSDLRLDKKVVNGTNAVQLNWQLGSNNANAIEVYRSESRSGAYSLLNNGVANGNTNTYLDTTVMPTTSVTYYYYLVASNAYGHSVSTDTVSITTDQYVDKRKWYLNFATSYGWMPYPDSPWNNIRSVSSTHLKDNKGRGSSVGLVLQTNWWNTTTKGFKTGDNSGVYPDDVIRDAYYFGRFGGPQEVTGEVTGLDPEKNYILTFFASSNWGFTTDNGHTVFRVGSNTESVYVQNNKDKTVSFANITPSSSGTISFTMSKGADAGAGYLNALVISTQTSIPPAVPVDMHLSNKVVNGGNAVQLDWQLGSNNASIIKVYRSKNRSGAYSLLNNEATNGNANHFLDTTVAPATSVTYYYYLIASNAYGNSISTDTTTITTSQYVDNRKWYLNFASNYGWKPYPGDPWNNIRGVSSTGLNDNKGNSSNVGLVLQTNWWNTITKGSITGDNSGVYPDDVLRDAYYFGRNGGPQEVIGQVTGLDPKKNYMLTFFASSIWGFTADNGHTIFQVAAGKDSIYVQSNEDQTISFANIAPSEDGIISFTMSKGEDAGAGYLNAMVISTQSNTPPYAPINLQLSNKIVDDANAIQLDWQPGSNNTDSISIYRSENNGNSFELIQSDTATTTFLDTAVSPLLEDTYYYYLVAINDNGHSVSSDTIGISTWVILPQSPIAVHLSDTVHGYKRAIKVNWQLVPNNKIDQIDIYRSTNGNSSYSILKQLDVNEATTSYLDTTVNINTTYYYYLVARNDYGVSTPSDTVSHTVPVTLPSSQIPTDIHLVSTIFENGWAVEINWKPASAYIDQIEVHRSTDRTGTYTLLNPGVSNGADTSYLDTSVTKGITYYYFLVSRNDYGSTASSDTIAITVPAIVPPLPPVIKNISDLTLAAGIKDTLQVDVAETGANIAFSLFRSPSFARIENNGHNKALIIFNPAQTDIGIYDSLMVTATDESNNKDTAYFAVKVTDGNLSRKIYMNFTGPGNEYANPWNNIDYIYGNNENYTNLVDGLNQPTGISMTVVNVWSGAQADGANTYNNTGVVPDQVMATGFYISDATSRIIKITGLDGSKQYNLLFFGSSNNGGSTNYTTNYTVNGETVTLNGIRNTSKSVRINGIDPSGDGIITISVSKGSGAAQGLLNAMILETYDSSALIAPSELVATAGEGKVILQWTDRSDNEQQFRILRSGSLYGSYTEIDDVNANSTSFVDNSVTANTRYFYKVVAVTSDGSKVPSDVASVTTSKFSVYVNFNLKENPAPAPWNNTQMPPQQGDVYGSLLDSDGNNTGITLNMISNFEGENPVGVNTGNNTGVYPDLVMESCYYMDNGFDTVVMHVSGLNLALKYDFTFFASISGFGWQNTTQFMANNQMVSIEASFNAGNTVTLSGLSPDEDGKITIKIINTPEAHFAVLNAMVINAYNNYDNQGNLVIDPDLYKRKMKGNHEAFNQNESIENATLRAFELMRLYPNPFHQIIHIQLNTKRDGKLLLTLYSANGQIMDRRISTLSKGANTVEYVPHMELQPGLYILTLRLDKISTIISVKVIKQ